jgi:hypothetical protein
VDILTAVPAASFNPKNEIAIFRAFTSRILAISNPTLAEKATLDQPPREMSVVAEATGVRDLG